MKNSCGKLKTLKSLGVDLDNNLRAQSILEQIEKSLTPKKNETSLSNIHNTKMLVENEGTNNLSTLVTSPENYGLTVILCFCVMMHTMLEEIKRKKKKKKII